MFGIDTITGYKDTCMVRNMDCALVGVLLLSAWALYGLAMGSGHRHTRAFDIGCI
jgi:hypothetical protein